MVYSPHSLALANTRILTHLVCKRTGSETFPLVYFCSTFATEFCSPAFQLSQPPMFTQAEKDAALSSH